MVDSSSAVQSNVDINKIATDLNNKADRDLKNSTPPYVVSREEDGTNQGVIELWSDGYCVMTGKFVVDASSAAKLEYNNKILTLSQPLVKITNWQVQPKHDCFQTGLKDVEIGQAYTEVTVFQKNLNASTAYTNPYVIYRIEGYIR